MAKRKIIWSLKARARLFEILDFYSYRNQSRAFSVKLYKKIIKDLKTLKNYPDIGIKTDFENVRGLIVSDYIYFMSIIKMRLLYTLSGIADKILKI